MSYKDNNGILKINVKEYKFLNNQQVINLMLEFYGKHLEVAGDQDLQDNVIGENFNASSGQFLKSLDFKFEEEENYTEAIAALKCFKTINK